MAVISRPKGAEVVVMNERYRADGAGGYFATPRGAEWRKHPGNPRFPHRVDIIVSTVRYWCISPILATRSALS